MSEDLIRYDILTQNALRSMIANLLEEITRTGLPGDHHFFITFDTCAPNVQLSARMKEKYPEEMTIVVQHRFWDLEVKNDGFQIGLSFDDIPEILIIPLGAIKGFYDPSVKFGLQFEVQTQDDETNKSAKLGPSFVKENAPNLKFISEKPKKKRKTAKKAGSSSKLPKDDKSPAKSEPFKAPEIPGDDKKIGDSDDQREGAQVVSLDSFRNKK